MELAINSAWWLKRNQALANRPNGTFLRALEKRTVKRIKRAFQQQQAYLIRELKNASYLKNVIEDEIDDLLNNMPGQKEITNAIIINMKAAMLKGGRYIIRELTLGEFGISFNLQNEEAIKILNDKEELELSNYRGNITGTTKARLKEILTEAARTGQSYKKTAKLIQEQGQAGVFSLARGELIATREIGVAYEAGNNIPVKEFLQKYPLRRGEKSWQTVNDDNVTPQCKENQNAKRWIPEDELFPSGDETAPRDGNPRCRCFTKYRIL